MLDSMFLQFLLNIFWEFRLLSRKLLVNSGLIKWNTTYLVNSSIYSLTILQMENSKNKVLAHSAPWGVHFLSSSLYPWVEGKEKARGETQRQSAFWYFFSEDVFYHSEKIMKVMDSYGVTI